MTGVARMSAIRMRAEADERAGLYPRRSRLKASSELPPELESLEMSGVPLQEAFDGLQPFASAIRGQVDLRQRDVRVLGRRVLLEELLQEADRVVGLTAGDENEREVVRGLAVARAGLQRLALEPPAPGLCS